MNLWLLRTEPSRGGLEQDISILQQDISILQQDISVLEQAISGVCVSAFKAKSNNFGLPHKPQLGGYTSLSLALSTGLFSFNYSTESHGHIVCVQWLCPSQRAPGPAAFPARLAEY